MICDNSTISTKISIPLITRLQSCEKESTATFQPEQNCSPQKSAESTLDHTQNHTQNMVKLTETTTPIRVSAVLKPVARRAQPDIFGY